MTVVLAIENSYHTKLNGYRVCHRNKWDLLEQGVLTLQELTLLDFYIDVATFDENKPDFGLFKTDFEDLCQIFNYKSDQAIRNWHNGLVSKGFIETTNLTNVNKLICPKRYFLNSLVCKGEANHYQNVEKDQPIEAILQHIRILPQSVGTEFLPIGTEQAESVVTTTSYPSIDIGSSKVVSSTYPIKVVTHQITIRGKEEYELIIKELDLKTLMVEDLAWIDSNSTEMIAI
ncbi:MAG: hypothetical protein NT141_04450 [candidate division WWE3 bacterium]|nr:hypothetical protein [candidate division WWE3 bacterium]